MSSAFKVPTIALSLYFAFQRTADCLSPAERKKINSVPTDVWIWGNGVLSDASLKYPNWYPKQILNFGAEVQIMNIGFGEYHEAYVDKKGKIHVSRKHSLPSKFLEGN